MNKTLLNKMITRWQEIIDNDITSCINCFYFKIKRFKWGDGRGGTLRCIIKDNKRHVVNCQTNKYIKRAEGCINFDPMYKDD